MDAHLRGAISSTISMQFNLWRLRDQQELDFEPQLSVFCGRELLFCSVISKAWFSWTSSLDSPTLPFTSILVLGELDPIEAVDSSRSLILKP